MSNVLVFGAATLDYVAQVNSFPIPDEKVGTRSLTICGGGNAANTATCLSRLGVKTQIISKIGDDSNGQTILKEFEQEANLDNSLILIKIGMRSPLTYIIVDISASTRTCLFSAGDEQILIDDIRQEWINQTNFIHFDSRSTAAAVVLARLAKQNSSRTIQCSLDLERERPDLDQLIPLMDYIITTEWYSQRVCKDETSVQTAIRLLQENKQYCQFVIVTRGKDGSIFLERANRSPSNLISNSDRNGSVVSRELINMNGDNFHLWTCSAWPIQPDDIIDTTGSGDAYIGAIIYGLIMRDKQWPTDRLLRFASYVAMCKLKGIGARSTLPRLSEINMDLFS